jgi:hypothetical protein
VDVGTVFTGINFVGYVTVDVSNMFTIINVGG